MLKLFYKNVNSSILKKRIICVKFKQFYSFSLDMGYINQPNDESFVKYQESIEKLNELQAVQPVHQKDFTTLMDLRINSTKRMCKKLNLSSEDINDLNIIHMTGTKGKGSTSAFTESIIRNSGYKTGLFTSPHLIEVKERIKINGKSLSYLKFYEYFSHCYDILIQKWSKEDNFEKPTYFQFLTCMSFYVFQQEKVDAAIIEVGIGGQFDFTNIIEKPVVCGITSLGLDHCSLLGNTIEQIAWQKSGILKSSCVGFVAQQNFKQALKVIRERSQELNAPVCIVNNVDNYQDLYQNNIDLGINGKVQYLNSQVALQISDYWLKAKTGKNFDKLEWIKEHTDSILDGIPVLKNSAVLDDVQKKGLQKRSLFIKGLNSCRWPGRNQIIEAENGKIKYYIDGAHTIESIEQFLDWFLELKKKDQNFSKEKTVLLFNYTGDRDPCKFLELLAKLELDAVAFSKLKAYPDKLHQDKDTFRKMPSAIFDTDEKYEKLLNLYKELKNDPNNNSNNKVLDSNVIIANNILEGLNWLTDSRDETLLKNLLQQDIGQSLDKNPIYSSFHQDGKINVLITGSLYLVGLTLKVLNFKID